MEALPADIVKSNGQIGIVKLKLLSSLSESEREEITESTDLENTAVSELKKKIKELEDKSISSSDKLNEEINRLKGENMKLKGSTEKTDELKAEIAKLKGNLQNEQDKVKDTVSRYDGRIASIVKSNEAKVNELENQIKDLESRPVEVVYEQDTQEIDRLKAEIARLEEELEEEKESLAPYTAAYKFDIIYENAKSAVQKAALFAVNNDCPEFVDRVRELKDLIDTLTE